jgi:hypothetical protein
MPPAIAVRFQYRIDILVRRILRPLLPILESNLRMLPYGAFVWLPTELRRKSRTTA